MFRGLKAAYNNGWRAGCTQHVKYRFDATTGQRYVANGNDLCPFPGAIKRFIWVWGFDDGLAYRLTVKYRVNVL